MKESSPRIIPFLVLNQAMRPDYREALARHVMSCRDQVDITLRRRLESAIREHVRVDGFRDPLKASPSRLARRVSQLSYRENALLGALLEVWVESQAPLKAAVEEFLTSEEIPRITFADLGSGFAGAWTISDMHDTTAAFCEDHAGFDEDDVALMLCCLSGRAPVTEGTLEQLYPEQTEEEAPQREERAMSGPKNHTALGWESWLDELRALPADAEEWKAVDEFIESVHEIAEAKRQELGATRGRLQEALEALVAQTAPQVDYFGLTEVYNWTSSFCPLASASQAAVQVDSLRETLLEYADLRGKRTTTLAGDRRRRKELVELEERIFAAYSKLTPQLSPATGPEEPPDVPDTERAAPTEELDTEERPPGTEAPDQAVTPELQTDGEAIERSHLEDADAREEATTARAEDESSVAEEEVVEPADEPDESEPLSFLAEEAATAPTEEPEDMAEAPRVEAEPVSREAREATQDFTGGDRSVVGAAGMPPAQEIAMLLQTQDCDEDWQRLVWALVAGDDLPGAFWLTRSLVATGRPAPVPSALLAAAQGTRWISSGSNRLVNDLLNIAQRYEQASEDALQLIEVSAALRPTLIAPYAGLIGWLRAPSLCPELEELVSVVTRFAKLGTELRAEDLRGVSGQSQREESILAAARAADVWLRQAPTRRMKLKRASDVWYDLVEPNGELRQLLGPASRDRRAEADRVRQRLEDWQDPGQISDRIDEVDRARSKAKFRQIVGDARRQLERHVQEACDLARSWCDLVQHEREIEERGTWLFEQVRMLRSGAIDAFPAARHGVKRLRSEGQSDSVLAASRCLQVALGQLAGTLDLQSELMEDQSLLTNTWQCLVHETDNLATALGRRLVWLPEMALDDTMQPLEEEIAEIGPVLRDACAEARSLWDAFDGWLERRDYRFIEWVLGALRDHAGGVDLSRRYQAALDGSRAALQADIDETREAIEQAVVDGIIADERSKYSADLESIDAQETVQFAREHEKLRRLRESLSKARWARLEQLRTDWASLKQQLAGSHIQAEKQKQASSFVQSALDGEDTRLVEESLARLRAAIDGGGPLSEDWFTRSAGRDALKELKDSMSAIEVWLRRGLPQAARDIKNGSTRADVRFGELSSVRRDEVAESLSAWRLLKQRQPASEDNAAHLETLLAYLGFELERRKGAPILVRDRGPNWVHVQVYMSARDLARPIPQFGSQAHGKHDVICLWERPEPGTIVAGLRDLKLGARPAIALYLGRLTERQRRDLALMSQERELVLAVLDETLLVHLARERGARLPTFLRCTLPFTALNPYTPFQAGDVPPEMFFGRAEMARELQRPAGSCLVYGGRQLGKSALLRHVERQFRYPDREQYAWIENLKLIFDPQAGKGAENIWIALRDRLKRENLLSPRIRTDRVEEIYRRVSEMMSESENRRVLVMYDEADAFLDADSSDGFREVTALRELMLETQRRFKVIFAGLHNVQRFQGIPNQPLAHFGTPLCVGPLEARAARQLVQEPMETLGYRFADQGAILRVLSYTNYHPGLIQLFCQELLKHFHRLGIRAMPPYYIKQSDVEAIYRNPNVRERIKERFDWTLALDTQYQAIAWSMIVDQMEMQDSYAQPYSPGDILKLVRSWWPQGFGDVKIDELRGLLDEMCGLGVLVRNTDGHYRLRGPNLVRLMGTDTDIGDRLLELSEEEPPQPPNADNHHAPVDEAAAYYSPLTYAQDRLLNPPRSGVGLVFASEALGLPMLPDAFQALTPRGLSTGGGHALEIPAKAADPRILGEWLKSHLEIFADYERLIFHHRLEGCDADTIESLVRAALRFSSLVQTKSRVRLLLTFGPLATWAWLSLPEDSRVEMETQADAVVWLRRWDTVGLRHRLSQHDKMDTKEVCQQVLEVTGGWHSLIEELFSRCGRQDDPRPAAMEMASELANPDSGLRQKYRDSLGLQVAEVVGHILHFIREMQEGMPIEFISELVGSDMGIAPQECERVVEYLERMGCLIRRRGMVSVDKTVTQVTAEP